MKSKPANLDLPVNGVGATPRPEIVYRQVKADIVSGALVPGQVLRQEELARRCNTSRVPVREAMSRLEADGFIVLRPNFGYTVVSLQPSDIVEIFELLIVIESHASTIAAVARTEVDIERARSPIEAMEGLDAKASDYMTKWLSLNRQFHGVLMAATRRKRLIKIAEMLRETVEPVIQVESWMTGHNEAADREHRSIFEAFEAGDAHGLSELCRTHVENTKRRLLSGLRSDQRVASIAEEGERERTDHRTVEVQAGQETITAADPLPDDLNDVLDVIHQPDRGH